MMVAVCATGFASTPMTPGRRDNTASATFIDVAHCTPDTSRTAVALLLVIAPPRLAAPRSASASAECRIYPQGVSSKRLAPPDEASAAFSCAQAVVRVVGMLGGRSVVVWLTGQFLGWCRLVELTVCQT